MRLRRTRWLAVVLTMWVLVAAGTVRGAERVGEVAGLEGRPEVLHAGASTWEPLALGDPVLLGDQLRTPADAKLRIVLREESALTLAPGSLLVVSEQLLAPATVSRFELLLGTVKAIVTERYAEPRARFEVETPTAIAGVRGTSFLAEYDRAREETLVVGLTDVTRVRAAADAEGTAEVELGPGNATRVRRGGRPAVPRAIPENQLRPLRNATELGPRARSGRRANALDARRPRRGGERAFSRQEQAVDQPLFQPGGAKPPPPPPPVPKGTR